MGQMQKRKRQAKLEAEMGSTEIGRAFRQVTQQLTEAYQEFFDSVATAFMDETGKQFLERLASTKACK